MKKLGFLWCFLCHIVTNAQVTLTQSNLPIISINTNGVAVPDEPKITATMKVFWKGDGVNNSVNDAPVFNGSIGIEKRGSTSQFISEKKPYSIEVRDALGNDVDTSLLGMPKESDWALIAPYSDKSLIRDALIYQWGRSFMAWSPRTKFCEVILNGSYQGVYVLTEKIKRNKNRVNVSKIDNLANSGDILTGGYILKVDKDEGAKPSGVSLGFQSNYVSGVSSKRSYLYHYPKPEDITTAQKTYLKTLLGDFENAMNGANFKDPTNGYAKYFDVNTLVDFLLLNEISRNVDGYRISTFLYKDKNSVSPLLKMGPIWDFNLGLGNADYCDGFKTTGWAFEFNKTCPTDGLTVPFWWEKLFTDAEFKKKMRARWQQLRAKELSNERLFTPIDSMVNVLKDGQVRNFQTWKTLGKYVWPNAKVLATYNEEIAYLKTWLTDRVKWLDNTMATFPTSTAEMPVEQALVSPNPSVSSFVFDYTLQNSGDVKLLIFNQLGQNIYQKNVRQTDGENQLIWDANVASGIYFYEILFDEKLKMAGKLVKE
jgi:spore coat protein CotH